MTEPRPWHALGVPETFAAIESSDEGLSPAEAARRLERDGPR